MVWVARVLRRDGKPLPDMAEHVVHQSVCWAMTDHGGGPATASSEPVAPTHLRCRSAVPDVDDSIPRAQQLPNCLVRSDTLLRADLSAVTLSHAPDYFMFCCKSLRRIDLPRSVGDVTVGSGFLQHCYALTHLDLAPLGRIVSVGTDFLGLCYALESVDLTALDAVAALPDDFLCYCQSLRALDCHGRLPFRNVVEIGVRFCCGCTALERVVFHPNCALRAVGSSFLGDCTALTSVDPRNLANVLVISSLFLSGSGIESFDASSLANAIKIGRGFLSFCRSLRTVNLEGLSRVTRIRSEMLDVTPSLTSLDLSPLTSLRQLPSQWLEDSSLPREAVCLPPQLRCS